MKLSGKDVQPILPTINLDDTANQRNQSYLVLTKSI